MVTQPNKHLFTKAETSHEFFSFCEDMYNCNLFAIANGFAKLVQNPVQKSKLWEAHPHLHSVWFAEDKMNSNTRDRIDSGKKEDVYASIYYFEFNDKRYWSFNSSYREYVNIALPREDPEMAWRLKSIRLNFTTSCEVDEPPIMPDHPREFDIMYSELDYKLPEGLNKNEDV